MMTPERKAELRARRGTPAPPRQAKPRLSIDQLAARNRCAERKRRGLPCTEFATAPEPPVNVVASKLAVVTLNIGGVLHPESRASLRHTAKRWGADFHEITQPLHQQGGLPHWNKAFLVAWAAERQYERCVYFDADILVRSDCPSPFDATPIGTLGVVTNDQFHGPEWLPGTANKYHRCLAAWAERLNLPCPEIHQHINSGVIVFDVAAHADLFARWQTAGKSCGWQRLPTDGLVDQPALSVLAHALPRGSVTWLPVQWNTLVYRDYLIRTAGVMQSYVYHYTGHRRRHIDATQWRLDAPPRPRPAHATPQRTPSTTLCGPDVDLARIVERVAVLNLDRRPDRWNAFLDGLPDDWPFPMPQRWRGIDTIRCRPPAWYRLDDAGQWGCLRAHQRAIEDALNDGLDSVMICEDDATFPLDFTRRVREFIAAVPDDWQVLFLGGCHTQGQRRKLSDLVDIPGYVTLAHCYLLRGDGLHRAYDYFCRHAPDRPEADHRLGQFALETACAVYSPREWLVYQAAGFSDIRGRERPLRGVKAGDAATIVG